MYNNIKRFVCQLVLVLLEGMVWMTVLAVIFRKFYGLVR